MIYVIRFLSALSLFALLAKANIWLDPISNIMLVLGYRFLLLLSPLIVKHLGRKSAFYAFLISSIGTTIWLLSIDVLMYISVLFIGLGISVGGYLIKSIAVETPEGAGFNKVALNLGSFLSGLVVATLDLNKTYFLLLFTLIFLICAFLSLLFVNQSKNTITDNSITSYRLDKISFSWTLIGLALGIKLFSVFAILPQLLLADNPVLPNWYGTAISLNSATIVLFQMPLIKLINKSSRPDNTSLIILMIGMAVISLPSFIGITTIEIGFLWIFVCSIIECFVSYLDVTASKFNSLLYKEASVGLGAALAVGVMRFFSINVSPIILSTIGFIAILIGLFLLRTSPLKSNLK